MMTTPQTGAITALRARSVNVPLRAPIKTASGAVTSAPLVLIDVSVEGGVTGRAYLFCYTTVALRALRSLLEDLAPLVVGVPASPRDVTEMLAARFRLLGNQGLVAMALAGIDMAVWDALAMSCELPLYRLLGAERRPIPVYDSLGIMSVQDAVAEATRSLRDGFVAMKFKVGAGDLGDDVQLVRDVRTATGASTALMVDYNQSLDRSGAVRRGRALETCGLRWIEEPCRADDDASHAHVAACLDTAIQLGENWWGPNDTARSLALNACDEVMLDVMKIGGVTGWLQAAALAAPTSRRVSSHLFPEISAHLLAATPHAGYLEWLDLASAIVERPVRPVDGMMYASDEPGSGLTWNEDAVARFAFA